MQSLVKFDLESVNEAIYGEYKEKIYSTEINEIFNNGSPKDVDRLLELVGGPPVIIKVARGSLGVGVVLAETKKAARSIIQAFYSQNVNILVQEFIEEARGEDIRAFVIDGKVVAAMKRKTLDEEEFRSNINLGGVGESVELTPREERAAIRAAKVMHLSIAGVDILRSKRGPLVMEVNAFPMLSGIEAATKIDIANQIIRYVERKVGVKPKRRGRVVV